MARGNADVPPGSGDLHHRRGASHRVHGSRVRPGTQAAQGSPPGRTAGPAHRLVEAGALQRRSLQPDRS